MKFLKWIQLIGKTLHGSICLWLVMTINQSSAHRGLRVLRFCFVSWKDERKPTIKYCMGKEINVVQKFTRAQNLGHNWWWANGIRVEHFPRIHLVAALPHSPRITVKIERHTREVYWTDHLHVDVQRHLLWIKRQQKKMRVKCSTRFSLSKEIWSRTIFQKENGTKLQSWWC